MRKRVVTYVLVVALGSICLPALAQSPIYYSAENFGRANKSFSESSPNAQVLEVLMERSDIFEPIYDLEAEDVFRKLGRAVGMLDLLARLPDGKLVNPTCTATLIAPNRAITNYHCVPGQEFTVTQAQLRLGFLDRMREPGQVFEVKLPAIEFDKNLDYAIVEVVGVPTDRFPPITLKAVSPRPRQSLYLIHHPASQPQRLTRIRCQAGDPVSNEGDLVHHCDTLGGSSGALVLTVDNDSFAGLHKAGVPDPVRPFNLATPAVQLAATGQEIKQLSNRQITEPATNGSATRTPLKIPEQATNGQRKLSTLGAALVSQYETFQPDPFDDAIGYCTVGFGHLIAMATCKSLDEGTLAKYRQLTLSKALELLSQDMVAAETAANSLVTRRLSQNEFDAIVSLIYSIGRTSFQRSTLLEAINADDDAQTVAQWRRWVRAGGRLVPGLLKRREDELKLYFGGSVPLLSNQTNAPETQ